MQHREHQAASWLALSQQTLHLHQLDVRREDDMLRVVGELPPQLDVLVNNA